MSKIKAKLCADDYVCAHILHYATILDQHLIDVFLKPVGVHGQMVSLLHH